MRGFIRFLSRLFTGALLIFFVWAFGLIWFLMAIPNDVKDRDTPTDAIVALTGGSGRLAESLYLLQQDISKSLFISGIGPGADLTSILTMSGQNKEEIERFAKFIELGYEAENTKQNAMEVANWARKNKVKSIRLVTANYHIPRSLIELKAQLPDVRIISHPVFPEQVKIEHWWKHEGTTRLVLLEYHKCVYALLRSRLSLVISH